MIEKLMAHSIFFSVLTMKSWPCKNFLTQDIISHNHESSHDQNFILRTESFFKAMLKLPNLYHIVLTLMLFEIMFQINDKQILVISEIKVRTFLILFYINLNINKFAIYAIVPFCRGFGLCIDLKP